MLMKKDNIFYNLSNVREMLLVVLLMIIYSFRIKNVYVKIVGVVLLLVLLFFFRNNLSFERNDNNIISPSSSKVISINENEKYINVYTYLSPLDRHFMIAPVDCKVIEIKEILLEGDAERTRVVLEDKRRNRLSLDLIVKKPMKGVGVFGGWVPKLFYNNRVVVKCKVGDVLKQGERFGLIRFGSNMEYNLPKCYKLLLKENKHINLGDKIGEI